MRLAAGSTTRPGKLAIPDTILRKQGPLEEPRWWEFIRRHLVIGQRILDAAATEVGKIVRMTHERWDETDYVDGLAAADRAARIARCATPTSR